VDPLRRITKRPFFWMDIGRNRSEVSEQTPICYLNLSVWPAHDRNMPNLVSLDELKQTFREFGRCLPYLLTKSPYSEVAGLTAVEWDAADLTANWAEQLLYQPEILCKLSRHHATDQQLSLDQAKKIIEGYRKFEEYYLLKEMYWSELDYQLHSGKRFWVESMREIWKKCFPFPLYDKDFHPCNDGRIVAENFSAAYYCQKWAEMLACDVMEACNESRFSENTCRRFRETFLGIGGGLPHGEVFRRFRGRDPSLEPICRFYSLRTGTDASAQESKTVSSSGGSFAV